MNEKDTEALSQYINALAGKIKIPPEIDNKKIAQMLRDNGIISGESILDNENVYTRQKPPYTRRGI